MLYFSFIPLACAQEENITVHDPVMIQQDNTYYLFNTGWGITVWSSKDMVNWKREESVFKDPPEWAVKAVPGFKGHIWAPDISYYNGSYYLYYSVSAFGKNTSCIGLAVNKTLDPDDPDFMWADQGKIIQSVPGRDLWNAIDPNLAFDESGTPWLNFGSFWAGMKMVKLRDDLKGIADPQEWYTIARRPRDIKTDDYDPGKGAIEAPFIFKKGKYYYLFVSFDYCCRGLKSNYKIMIGRSGKITGPYIDRDGVPMLEGGGTLVLGGSDAWPGVGHNSAYTFDGTDYLVFHAYDASDNGKPKLRIKKMAWDEAGWPVIEE
ncbi:MAG: arabinan endo-1,5-alpha-L-arabinosidase [Bacteroidales bacterium]|nr:MAG: arabinan endo-1,5-alpha-L-arabinosidase [Bacteroidales bacterium]